MFSWKLSIQTHIFLYISNTQKYPHLQSHPINLSKTLIFPFSIFLLSFHITNVWSDTHPPLQNPNIFILSFPSLMYGQAPIYLSKTLIFSFSIFLLSFPSLIYGQTLICLSKTLIFSFFLSHHYCMLRLSMPLVGLLPFFNLNVKKKKLRMKWKEKEEKRMEKKKIWIKVWDG